MIAATVGGVLGWPALAACSRSGPLAGDQATTPSGPPAVASASEEDSSSSTPAPGTPAPAPPRPGPDITHGPAGVDAVALTFHGAGDVGLLRRMLSDLAAGGARVTVLAIGQWLAGEPGIARQILDGGHELGNHTWSHPTMTRLPDAAIRTEVDRAAGELRRLTGSPGRWFRPSGTPQSTPAIRAAARAAGYGACLGYDVDPLDYADPGAAAVVARLAAGVRPGSIVSLHLGHPGTIDAMPQILDVLRTRSLTAVTASDLLARR